MAGKEAWGADIILLFSRSDRVAKPKKSIPRAEVVILTDARSKALDVRKESDREGGIGGYPIKPIILDTEGIFSIISCSSFPSFCPLTSIPEVHHGASPENGPITFLKGSGCCVPILIEA
jgi:hypothetical protein